MYLENRVGWGVEQDGDVPGTRTCRRKGHGQEAGLCPESRGKAQMAGGEQSSDGHRAAAGDPAWPTKRAGEPGKQRQHVWRPF